MKKYLLFRTDRIGDYLISAVLINSIKRNNPNSYIEVVASNNNFNYIKSFKYIDKVYLLKNNVTNKIKFFFKFFLSRYDAVIIHDSKKRSSFISFAILCKLKIKFIKENYFSHKRFIIHALNELNYNFLNDDLNTLKFRDKFAPNEKYCVFHYDEKWSNSNYIKEYISIEPNESELINFLENLSQKVNSKIIITTGLQTPLILEKISNKLSKNMSIKTNIDYFYLESIISSSSLLISCHGFVSHVASSSNVKQIDIIEGKSETEYKKWTEHFRKYNSLHRKKFSELSNEILNIL